MTLGKYQLTVTRGAVEVLRQGIDDLEEAHRAVAEALVQHPDCEVRLNPGRRGTDFGGAGAIELTPMLAGSRSGDHRQSIKMIGELLLIVLVFFAGPGFSMAREGIHRKDVGPAAVDGNGPRRSSRGISAQAET